MTETPITQTHFLPADFVDLVAYLSRAGLPNIEIDIRYASDDNFLGHIVPGYEAPRAWLTRAAADALAQVQLQLTPQDHSLLIFDAYRPQRAVDAFIAWSKNADYSTKAKYYPTLEKTELFEQGYLARHSSHSRGSTLDLTIIKTINGNNEALEMGSGFDFFGSVSHTNCQDISAIARNNRDWLLSLMDEAGFDNLASEWWHYTLRNEPWAKRYFDAPIR